MIKRLFATPLCILLLLVLATSCGEMNDKAKTPSGLEVNSMDISIAHDIVLSIHNDFMNVMKIISPGLLSTPEEPVRWERGELVGGIESVDYNGRLWLPATNSEDFPHIRSTLDVQREFLTVFTEDFVSRTILVMIMGDDAPFYIDIDGVLHRAFADFPTTWSWLTDDIVVEDLSASAFTACVVLSHPNEAYAFLKMEFALTEYGWRINNVNYR